MAPSSEGATFRLFPTPHPPPGLSWAMAQDKLVSEIKATDPAWTNQSTQGKFPWELGCKCDVCYLGFAHREARTFRPVMPEINPGSKNLIVAENPGRTEVVTGCPMSGKSGKEAENNMLELGIRREDFSWDNAALCFPPGADTRMMLADMARENRRRASKNQPALMNPFEACLPHITAHVLARPRVLAFGKYAMTAVTGKSASMRKVRGSLMDRWTVPTGSPEGSHGDDDLFASEVQAQLRPNGGLLFARNVRIPGPGQPPLYPDEILPMSGSQRVQIVPTMHPAFILRKPAWRPVLKQDIGRFWRWIQGELRWEVPTFRFCPTPAEVADFLWPSPNSPFKSTSPLSAPGLVACDVETDGKSSLHCLLRCIGLARPEGGIVIPFLSPKRTKHIPGLVTPTPFTPLNQKERIRGRRAFSDDWAVSRGCIDHDGAYYSSKDAQIILSLLKAFFKDPTRTKVFHNGYYDTPVLIRELALDHEIEPVLDTILYFRGCHSELTRDLYTLGTLYTDVPDWKAGADERKIATDPRDEIELAIYNNNDTTVTARCAPLVFAEASQRGQLPAIQLDHQVQKIYRDAHTLGMRVDEPKRKVWEENHQAEKESLLKNIRSTLNLPKFNPFSTRQLSRLLYTDWRLPVLFKTDTGEDACDDDTLREFLIKKVLEGERLEVVRMIRRLRTVNKQLSTNLLPFRPWNDYRLLKETPPEVELDVLDLEENTKKKKRVQVVDDDDLPFAKHAKGGLCMPDGRIHSNYNVHTAKTGRTSSNGPNFQNLEKWLRALLIPEGGNLYVGSDEDQIELRLVAVLAKLDRYIETIQKGGDPHALTAELLYGEEFLRELEASSTPEDWAFFKRTGIPIKAGGKLATKKYISLRVLAKTFIYAVIYGGSARTIYESVSSAESDNGDLLFPDLTYPKVQIIYNRFMQGLPELNKWWDTVWTFAQVNKHLCEPVLNRRRDFPAFERNEIPNLAIQGAAGIIMSKGLVNVRKHYPPNFALRRGLVNQCHDALVVECGRNEAPWVAEMVREAMTMEYFGMKFENSPEISEDLAHA